VSHPIPLHTAERLERAFEASFQRVAARGAKGWVMRIVAYFACQYAAAVIELLEGLLAEYRAGTLVFPARGDDSSTNPADGETREQRTATSGARGPASRSSRASHGAHADNPSDGTADSPERSAAPSPRPPSPCHPAFTFPSPRPSIRRPEHGPRGGVFHPSHVPRSPIFEIEGKGRLERLAHIVAISKLYAAIARRPKPPRNGSPASAVPSSPAASSPRTPSGTPRAVATPARRGCKNPRAASGNGCRSR
jgi:hypothetical protein